MPIDKKVFYGGLDTDKDDRIIENGSYRDALNVRVMSSDGSDVGAVENVKGNVLNLLPPGYVFEEGAKCIGSHASEQRDSVIWFVYSPNGQHGIYERFHESGIIKVVLINSILNFSEDHLINHINDIEGLLYWTDNYNPPRKINIEKATKHMLGDPDGYSSLLENGTDLEREQFINAMKAQPVQRPSFNFLTDDTVKTNNVRGGRYFKFKYRYVYDDNEKSAWSPTSDLTYTDLDFLSAFSNSEIVSENSFNYINIYFNSGHETVRRVEICASENDSDFFLVTDVDVSNSVNQEEIYSFYNDGVYTFLEINESIKPFDDVPRLANAQELVDGNKLVYGNYLSGYDNHEVNAQLSVDYEAVSEYLSDLENPPTFGPTVYLSDGLSLANKNYRDPNEPVNEAIFSNGLNEANTAPQHAILKRKFRHTAYSFQQIIQSSGYNLQPGINVEIAFSSGKDDDPYSDFMPSAWGESEYSVYSTPPPTENNIISVSIPLDASNPYEYLFDYLSDYDLVGSNGMYAFGNASGVWRNSIPPGFLLATPWSTVAYNFHQYENSEGDSFSGLRFFDKIHFLSENENPDISLLFNSSQPQLLIDEINDYLGGNSYGGYYWFLTDQLAANISGGFSNVGDTGETAGTIGVFSFKLRISNLGADSSDSFPMSNSFSTFKGGAYHSFALAYHDDYGRHSLLNIINEGGVGNSVYVPHLNERGDTASLNRLIANINWTITSAPPSWAKYYSWYYSGNTIGYDFIQFVASDYPSTYGNIPPETTPEHINISLKSITDYNNQTTEASVSYDFAPGDRIRFLRYANGDYIDETIDLPIIKAQDFPGESTTDPIGNTTTTPGQYIITIPRNANLEAVSNENNGYENLFFEIYKRKNNKSSEDEIYYEISEKFPIGEFTFGLGTGSPITTLAHLYPEGTFNRGDVYVSVRSLQNEEDTTYFISESPSISDTVYSKYRDGGRANYSDNDQGETRYTAQVTYSMPYVSGTKINGLSNFNPVVLPFKEYDRSNGPIQKLFSQDNQLIIFQEDKVNKSMVSRNVIFDNQGGGTLVGTTANVLSDAISYQGDYGISRNPESFAEFGGRIYFTDAKRGSVLRLSRDGLTPISEYGMGTYFMDELTSPDVINGKVIGGFDPDNGEYIISFRATTIAFHEPSKRWSSRYSFVPDSMVYIFKDLISFKDGNFYLHNANEERNNFYGENYSSMIEFVSNASPSDKKVFLAIGLESSDAWACPQITTPSGQETNLLATDFDEREGYYYSDILFDVNTPNVENPLIEGDRIRDYAATIKLTNNSTEKVELFAANVNLVKSFRHNG
jgi:hypothetical protein